MPTATLPSSSRPTTRRRHLDLLTATDAAGDLVDRQIAARWRDLLALLRAEQKRRDEGQLAVSPALQHQVRDLFAGMHRQTIDTMGQQFRAIAHHAHRTEVQLLKRTLPLKTLRAAVRKPRQSAVLREDTAGRHRGFASFSSSGITTTIDPLLPPSSLPNEEQRDLLAELLFPPPSETDILAILRRPVAGLNWLQDMTQASKLAADPHALAQAIAGAFAAGLNPRQIAQQVQPLVQNVKTSAKRIARTYGMQIAHRAQMDAHAQLGDLVIGYQVHSAKSPNSRKWHVARDGTIYYLNPKPGQKGPAQMPHPPLEAEDASERPAGTAKTAWN